MNQTATKKPPQKRSRSPFNIGFRQEKDYFIENLAMLLTSGMTMIQAIEAVKSETKTAKMLKIMTDLEEEINSGSALWRALAKLKIFPDYIISLVRVGEQSGRLAENLKMIVEERRKDRIFKSQIYSATMYPILILLMALIVGTGIAWFILPKLASVFKQLRIDLPITTRALIALGEFLGQYGIYVVPFFLLFTIFLVYFLFFNSKTKHLGQGLLFRLPGTKRLILEIEISRFGYILGNLLEAGLPISDALSSLKGVATFRAFKKLYGYFEVSIAEGNSFKKTFANLPKINNLISNPLQQMIVAGEQSGNLSDVLLKIGKIYEEKINLTTKNLAIILEPVLLIIVWVVVLLIALSVIMPIYSLIGGMNK